MTILIESLKRLYKNQKINLDKIENLLKENKITQEQYNYIVSEEEQINE